MPWEPTTSIFRGYNPYFGGLKPSFFMVLGSKGGYKPPFTKTSMANWKGSNNPTERGLTVSTTYSLGFLSPKWSWLDLFHNRELKNCYPKSPLRGSDYMAYSLPKKQGYDPGRLSAGTWEYTPGKGKSSEPKHHDFRFLPLIFRGVVYKVGHQSPVMNRVNNKQLTHLCLAMYWGYKSILSIYNW